MGTWYEVKGRARRLRPTLSIKNINPIFKWVVRHKLNPWYGWHVFWKYMCQWRIIKIKSTKPNPLEIPSDFSHTVFQGRLHKQNEQFVKITYCAQLLSMLHISYYSQSQSIPPPNKQDGIHISLLAISRSLSNNHNVQYYPIRVKRYFHKLVRACSVIRWKELDCYGRVCVVALLWKGALLPITRTAPHRVENLWAWYTFDPNV